MKFKVEMELEEPLFKSLYNLEVLMAFLRQVIEPEFKINSLTAQKVT